MPHGNCRPAQPGRQAGGLGADIAGAQREHHVAVQHDIAKRPRQALYVGQEHRFRAAAGAHRPADCPSVGAGNGGFTGRIHLGHQHPVGDRQHFGEIVEQIAGAGVAMRLKHRHQAAAGPGFPGRLQGSRNFAGMMRIIVHQRYLAAAGGDIPQQFKTAPQGTAFRQRLADEFHVEAQLIAQGHGGQRIQSVVAAGKIDVQERALAAGENHLQARPQSLAAQLHAAVVRFGGKTIGADPALHAGQNRGHAGIVGAGQKQAVERQIVGEFHERPAETAEIAAVGREMVVVDIGDHRHHRLQMQKGGIALVGLGNQAGARAQLAAHGVSHLPAHYIGGVLAGAIQHFHDQVRRGGLAVGPGHRNAVALAHQFRENVRPRHHRQAGGNGSLEFDIVRRDGGRTHHQVGIGHLGGAMPVKHLHPEALQMPRGSAGEAVRTLHLVSQTRHHLGQTTHAGAADSHKVDAAHPPGQQLPHTPAPASRQALTTSPVAWGRPSSWARSARSRAPARLAANRSTACARASADNSRSAISEAAPRLTR